jgi:hypothetical protein
MLAATLAGFGNAPIADGRWQQRPVLGGSTVASARVG